MNDSVMRCRFGSRVFCVVAASLCVIQVANAQAAREGIVYLEHSETKFGRLAPDVLQTTLTFEVDDADSIVVRIVAGLQVFASAVTAPGAVVLNPQTVGAYGGVFGAFPGAVEPGGMPIPMGEVPGLHHVYIFPSLGAGTYAVIVEVAVAPAEDVAVLVEVATDSPVGVALFPTQSVLLQGSTGVLVGAVFDGTTPVTGANVQVWLKPPTGDAGNLMLLDNGTGVDTAVGDGLYSGTFDASQAGPYIAVAEITGLSGSAAPFLRTAATDIEVVQSRATYTGASFTDQGVDTNGNGKFERLRIDRPVSVTTAGDYIFTVTLETALGKELRAYGRQTLNAGAQVASAYVEAPAIVTAGEDGPYTIRAAELLYIGPNGAVPADRLYGGTQQTQAYLLSQFERPPIVFTGVTSDRGIDTDSDGDFDVLEVKVQVRVTLTGTYRYTVSLENGCEGVIESLRGEQQMSSGAVQDLVLNFAGARIGARGMDGPYLVRNLFFTGPMGPNATSISRGTVGETQAYVGGQFDAYVPAPDCNLNNVPDECDLENCPPGNPHCQDCNSNGIPDECDIANCPSGNPACQDCNENGVPDGCETAADAPIMAWEYNSTGQCNVPAPNSGFVALAAGAFHSLGLKADGSIVAWGDNSRGQCDVPLGGRAFVGIDAGMWHNLSFKARAGACCFNGCCLVIAAADCATQGGVYQGDGTTCEPNPCPPPTGACCAGSSCYGDRTAAECALQGGVYQGDGTTCTPNPCPICRGDLNCDGVISFDDINPFGLALSNWAQWKATYPNCQEQNADVNGDGLYGGANGFGDINPFSEWLASGGGQPIPCP